MNTQTTTIYTAANVQALMITGRSARFEIVVDGQVSLTIPATKAWRAEKVTAVNAARALAGLPAEPAPVAVEAQIASRLHDVASSFISQVGYSAARQELTIVFTNGSTYIYRAVTMSEFNRLRRAPSVGKAYHAIVRGKKAGFPLVKAA